MIDWPSEYWLVGWLYFGRVISGLQWVAGWLVNRLIDWLIVCLLGLLVVWLHCVSIDWLTNWLVNRWIDWLIDWFDWLSKWTRVSEWMSEWLLNPILNNDPVPFKDTEKMRGIYFCIVSLLPESTQISNHSYKLYCKLSRINCFKYSFFNNVISYWNNLPSNVVEAGTLELFKCKLKSFLKL